jgi:hypothetical protein
MEDHMFPQRAVLERRDGLLQFLLDKILLRSSVHDPAATLELNNYISELRAGYRVVK